MVKKRDRFREQSRRVEKEIKRFIGKKYDTPIKNEIVAENLGGERKLYRRKQNEAGEEYEKCFGLTCDGLGYGPYGIFHQVSKQGLEYNPFGVYKSLIKSGECFEEAGAIREAEVAYRLALRTGKKLSEDKSLPDKANERGMSFITGDLEKLSEVQDGLNAKISELRTRRRAGNSSVTVAILGVLGGIFFLSTNITGNAIANIGQGFGNILGTALLFIGLVAGFFWLKYYKR
ncbi:hypothetical protein FJZ20_01995 [Candidatus Pacearchaeota archaeon]|nr:hypothetical protein [Candidatus Pacearchaeota archaeon]